MLQTSTSSADLIIIDPAPPPSSRIPAYYIYVLGNVSFGTQLKIGYSRVYPKLRAKALSTTGVPTPFFVVYFAAYYEDSSIDVEARVHAKLDKLRVKRNREFFDVKLRDVIYTIRRVRGPDREYIDPKFEEEMPERDRIFSDRMKELDAAIMFHANERKELVARISQQKKRLRWIDEEAARRRSEAVNQIAAKWARLRPLVYSMSILAIMLFAIFAVEGGMGRRLISSGMFAIVLLVILRMVQRLWVEQSMLGVSEYGGLNSEELIERMYLLESLKSDQERDRDVALKIEILLSKKEI